MFWELVHTRHSGARAARRTRARRGDNLQDGVELGIFIKEAMQSAGKPFGELTPEQIGAALREYEMMRSHRVCHIIGKSGFIGNLFLFMGFLVRALFIVWPLAARSGQRAALQTCHYRDRVRMRRKRGTPFCGAVSNP